MPVWIRNYGRILIATGLILSFCWVAGEAQTRKKKRTRRTTSAPKPVITNPPIAPPDETQDQTSAGDMKIISTADSTQEQTQTEQPRKQKATTSERDEMQKTITTLTEQVNKLNDKLARMQEDDRYQLDMERLTRAEQRAEQLRSQLMDIQSKIADFEARLEQVDFALLPENIETSTAGYGTMRPEQAREARKKQLEGEKSRVQTQLKLAESSRARLEVAVENADTEVDLLRDKLNHRREQMDAAPTTIDKPRRP